MNDSVISSDKVYPLYYNDNWWMNDSVVSSDKVYPCIIVITDRWMTVLSVVIMYIHCIIVITDR